ncbi:8606_t:CDS:1 [Acaulospora morrowiae]|uniref:Dihydrofolate synthetase n=1 Tax=Acaulospora morrowiae TaxID=94023 RepID=A0A9N8Z3C6_9GLOM|nr:8606_t:CDS:1 [Acaulospora morrowiae]
MSTFSGFKLTLDKIYALLKHANNPHLRLSAIHIAGTNGKGSTSAYIDFILLKSNFKTGRLNTPHLCEPRDSIRINGVPITKEDYQKTYSIIKTIDSNHNIGASLYELLVATAYWWFDAQRVDVAIVEVGVGGRLDATNVFDSPILSIITSIGWDHEELLGNSIEAISKEKAGIMKPDCKVIISPQIEEAAMKTLKNCAIEIGCSHSICVMPAKWSSQKIGYASLELLDSVPIEFHVPLLGDYQLNNTATAVTAIDLLRKTEVRFSKITDDNIKDGIASTRWPGRLQYIDVSSILGNSVTEKLLVDAAHNPQGAKLLRDFIDKLLQKKDIQKVHWIYAATRGKDVRKCLDLLLRDGDTMIANTFSKVEDMPWVNCCETEDLVTWTKELNREINISTAKNLVDALQQVYGRYEKEGGVVVMSGSIYLLADLYRLLEINE